MAKILKIASIASEVSPYSKSGGLGDVTKSLPKALSQLGHKVSIITPCYSFICKKQKNLENVDKKFTVKFKNNSYPIIIKKLTISNNLTVYFIGNAKLFGNSKNIYGYKNDNLRFFIFNIAVLKMLELLKLKPNIIHCHDWQAGMIPNLLKLDKKRFPSLKKSATIFTIHNLTFQMSGGWWNVPANKKDNGRNNPLKDFSKIKYLNFTKRAIYNADIINTVSERYAEEITSPELGQGLDKYLIQRSGDLYGIINGIDYTIHNPAFDNNLKYKYDWNSLRRKSKNKLALQQELGLEQKGDIPLIGMTNRLTEQKGFKLIMENIEIIMKLPIQLVIVGSGFREYILFFKKYAKKYPHKLALVTPFTEIMESKIYAGSDMFLMPSRFEPCGISQLKSLRYGSVPIVHETGGLSDTIRNYNPKTRKGNGFVFKQYDSIHFMMALARALENYKFPQFWEHLTWKAMQQTYSWELPAKKYIRLFNIALKKKAERKKI
ncbi:MAG: glycogen synthase [Candidatus Kerfeldbacteria bacterium]